jgi:hypothetical protein
VATSRWGLKSSSSFRRFGTRSTNLALTGCGMHPAIAGQISMLIRMISLQSPFGSMHPTHPFWMVRARTDSDARRSMFKQAIRLCPVSPEASFRLAKMYVQNERISDAVGIMDAYVKRDPPYSRDEAIRYLNELRGKDVQNKAIDSDEE